MRSMNLLCIVWIIKRQIHRFSYLLSDRIYYTEPLKLEQAAAVPSFLFLGFAHVLYELMHVLDFKETEPQVWLYT
jgi:hypothetical protein